MSSSVRAPAIVAELGRQETPDETANRKAANTRKHRANQTVQNLVLSLLASLAIVLLLVLVVVRPDAPTPQAVDYQLIAEQAQADAAVTLAAPAMPSGWAANNARLETIAGVQTWYIGFITPETQFIALSQGIAANPTWQANLLRNAVATGEQTIDGISWTVFDNRTGDDPGNLAYAMMTTAGTTTYLIYGTATADEFLILASSLATEVRAADD